MHGLSVWKWGARLGAPFFFWILAGSWSVPSRGGDATLAIPQSLSEHFPAGSINERADADRAIQAAARERILQEARYAAARAECNRQFLAERCLVAAREVNHGATQKIRAVELAARAYKRQDDARVIDQRRTSREMSRRDEKSPRTRNQERDNSAPGEESRRTSRTQREVKSDAPELSHRVREHGARMERRTANRLRIEAQEIERAAERKQRAHDHAAGVEEALRRAAEKEAKTANKRNQKQLQKNSETAR